MSSFVNRTSPGPLSKDIINSIYEMNVRSSKDIGANINKSIESRVYHTYLDELITQILEGVDYVDTDDLKGVQDFSE